VSFASENGQRRKFTNHGTQTHPEQVIAKVRQGQKMLNDGRPMVEVIKELQVTEATWYRWPNQYGSEKNAKASKRTQGAGEGERPAQAAAG
jgi:transposase